MVKALLLLLLQGTVTLTWTQGTDNVTPQPLLQYELRQSRLPDIDTLENAERNGVVVKPYTAAIDTTTVENLIPGNYYYNVIIKDQAGNRAVYQMHYVEVQNPAPPSTPPIVSFNLDNQQLVDQKKYKLKVSAVDDLGVVRLDLYMNGVWVTGDTDGTLDYTWNCNPYKGRDVVVQASAKDGDGQITTRTVTVAVATRLR